MCSEENDEGTNLTTLQQAITRWNVIVSSGMFKSPAFYHLFNYCTFTDNPAMIRNRIKSFAPVIGSLVLIFSTSVTVAASGKMEERLRACTARHQPTNTHAAGQSYASDINGKPAEYLYQQLLNFREGRRLNPSWVRCWPISARSICARSPRIIRSRRLGTARSQSPGRHLIEPRTSNSRRGPATGAREHGRAPCLCGMPRRGSARRRLRDPRAAGVEPRLYQRSAGCLAERYSACAPTRLHGRCGQGLERR